MTWHCYPDPIDASCSNGADLRMKYNKFNHKDVENGASDTGYTRMEMPVCRKSPACGENPGTSKVLNDNRDGMNLSVILQEF